MSANVRSQVAGPRIGYWLVHGLFILLCMATVLPLVIVLVVSITPADHLFEPFASLVPRGFTTDHYQWLGERTPVASYARNSAIMAVGITVGQLATSVIAAYAFVFLRFRGRYLLYILCLATLAVPFQVNIIPNFLLVRDLGWMNTFAGLIIPQIATAFGLFFLYQVFRQFPPSIIEAAYMDGSSTWNTLWRVVAPANRSAIAALGILFFLNAWNEYFWPFLITTEQSRLTLQLGIHRLLDFEGGVVWGPVMAATALAALPPLLVFAVARRQVMESFMQSGIKG